MITGDSHQGPQRAILMVRRGKKAATGVEKGLPNAGNHKSAGGEAYCLTTLKLLLCPLKASTVIVYTPLL